MKSKIWTLLIAVASAFLLWLYVISVVSPGSTETFYNIPVVMQGQGALADGLVKSRGKHYLPCAQRLPQAQTRAYAEADDHGPAGTLEELLSGEPGHP